MGENISLMDPDIHQSISALKLLEVICRSTGKSWRFAPGVATSFVLSTIWSELKASDQIVHIIAAKEGEEPIVFGPDSKLMDCGDDWKLYTVMRDRGLADDPGTQVVDVTCRSTGKVWRFADGVKAGFAVSMINKKLKAGQPLALYIEAAKEKEVPVVFGPDSLLKHYGDGWKLYTTVTSLGLQKNHQASNCKTPEISLTYMAKIILAFVLMFVFAALLVLALDRLPHFLSPLL